MQISKFYVTRKRTTRKNADLFLDMFIKSDRKFQNLWLYETDIADPMVDWQQQKNYSLFSDNSFIKKVLEKFPLRNKSILDDLKELKIFPVFVSENFYKLQNNNIHFIGDAFFAFPPSFAQGASQSIEGAYDLFKSIENSTESNFFKNRVNKTKMVNIRSKFNQFAFHLSNPLSSFVRKIYTLLYEESNTYYSVSVVATHDLMAILSVRIIYG